MQALRALMWPKPLQGLARKYISETCPLFNVCVALKHVELDNVATLKQRPVSFHQVPTHSLQGSGYATPSNRVGKGQQKYLSKKCVSPCDFNLSLVNAIFLLQSQPMS